MRVDGERPPGPPEVITCIDCGGRAHLLTTWDPDDPPMAGDLATYRCEDCNDRWDLFLTEVDTGE